jgi:DNA-directed RNA polymerase specialized sigma24 family protein
MITRRATSESLVRGNIPHTPDPDIMRQLAGGEIGALGELYDRYHEPVRRFVARATSDADDVDDLVHATFLAAAKSAGRYDGRPSCRPWLIGIAAQLLRRRRQSFGRFLAVLSSLRRGRRTELRRDCGGAWPSHRYGVDATSRGTSRTPSSTR